MLWIKLLPVLALLGAASAAPVKDHTLSKRALPFVGGVNLAVSCFLPCTNGQLTTRAATLV
jgi:hypothetical protein